MSQSSQTRNPNPQLGPAMALVQLLSEHPELPRLDWRIAPVGFYGGALQGDCSIREDARPVVEAWLQVLGGSVTETTFTHHDEPMRAFGMTAYWQDVRVELDVRCPVSALAETVQVAA